MAVQEILGEKLGLRDVPFYTSQWAQFRPFQRPVPHGSQRNKDVPFLTNLFARHKEEGLTCWTTFFFSKE